MNGNLRICTGSFSMYYVQCTIYRYSEKNAKNALAERKLEHILIGTCPELNVHIHLSKLPLRNVQALFRLKNK